MAERPLVILVDTSVWAAFFNGRDLPEVAFLDGLLGDGEQDVVIIGVILTEVLQGFRTDKGFDQAREALIGLPVFDPTLEVYVGAARLYRRLRRKGITVRGAVDALIAEMCITLNAAILTLDSDFKRIADHSQLQLARPA